MSDHLPEYPPTWTQRSDLDGHRWWIVYDSCEGFQPAYALVQDGTAQDAEEAAEEASAGYLQTGRDTIVVGRVSANWAEDQIEQGEYVDRLLS